MAFSPRNSRYSVTSLNEIKKNHENWVKTRLSSKKSENSKTFFVFRVDKAIHICKGIFPSHACYFENDPLADLSEAELISNFSQTINDYSDVWSEIETKNRIMAQLELDQVLKEIDSLGFLVYLSQRKEIWQHKDILGPFNFDVCYIFILRKTNPLVSRKTEEIEKLLKNQDQEDSEFTNFIPITKNTTSTRLI